MRNRAALTLMELSLMLLVFALAATLCMRAFMWANETSKACDTRDQALRQVQNVAEVLKTYGGAIEEAALLYGGTCGADGWVIHYSEQWEQVGERGTYRLVVEPQQSAAELLGTADIRALCGETCLLQMEVAWQEVRADA